MHQSFSIVGPSSLRLDTCDVDTDQRVRIRVNIHVATRAVNTNRRGLIGNPFG